MPVYTDEHILTSMHDFKTNMSKYTRMLERGDYKAVQVHRYNELIGVFLTLHSHERFERRATERAEAERRGDEMALTLDDIAREKSSEVD